MNVDLYGALLKGEKVLDEKIALLEEKITRLEDYNGICKVQSLYQHYLHKSDFNGIMSVWADAEDITMEAGDSGVYVGRESIKRFFSFCEETFEIPGLYAEHHAIQPLIEIAKDGKSAKGIWFSPGATAAGEIKEAVWAWGRYDCVYVKENDEWKILHMRWLTTWETSFEKGWVVEPCGPISSMRVKPIYPPDEKPSLFLPYSPWKINDFSPRIPKPYDTLSKPSFLGQED